MTACFALPRLTAVLVLGTVLAACSAHTEKTAERSASPLLGTWTRVGNVSQSSGQNGPQFTKLAFAADGSLQASYVASGVGAIIGSSPSVKSENDTYATPGGGKLSIAEGTRHLAYSYRLDGTTLYLTPFGAGDAAQFTKAG